MAKKNRRDNVQFDENAQVELTGEEIVEGEQKESKKREPSARTVLKNKIFEYLTTTPIADLPTDLGNLVNEYVSLPGRETARGERKPSRQALMREMMLEQKDVHEDVFYKDFKIGRLECKRIMYNLRKKVSDANTAIYVSFDPATGLYHLAGQGIDPPEGFEEK